MIYKKIFTANKRSTVFILVIVSLFMLSVIAAGCGGSKAEPPAQKSTEKAPAEKAPNKPSMEALSFGTSSIGSSIYTMAVGMGDIINKKIGINVAVEPVGGSDANVNALADKKVDIGILNSYAGVSGFQGVGNFAKRGEVPLRILVQGSESIRQLVVRDASGIKTLADLKGKTVIGKRKSLQELEQVLNAMLKASGVDPKDVNIIETAQTGQACEALKLGTADAAVLPGGVGSSTFIDLAESTPVTWLPIPDDKLSAVIKELGSAFHKVVIPKGTYKGQEQDAAFPSMTVNLTVLDTFPEDTAYDITKTIMESKTELKAVHATGKHWGNSIENPAVPYHSGAVKYFKEKNMWTPELEKIQNDMLKG